MRKMHSKKRIVAGLTVFLLTVLFLYYLQLVLMPERDFGYYEENFDHQIIFLGDCEVYTNISPCHLYDEYGLTSYVRGSAQQLSWQSYYLLEDTLRYEKPEVVVFNVLALKYNEPQKEEYNRLTLDSMKWSTTKWNAITSSMTEDEKMIEYIFPILRYHDRWSKLTWSDFLLKKNAADSKEISNEECICKYKGFELSKEVVEQKKFPPKTALIEPHLGDNAMDYLQKMSDLCKEEGIQFVLVKAPIEYPYWYEEWETDIEDFAKKNDLPYINGLESIDEIGIDGKKDFSDGGEHFNIYGAEKWTHFLGKELLEKCELSPIDKDSDCAAEWNYILEEYKHEKEN